MGVGRARHAGVHAVRHAIMAGDHQGERTVERQALAQGRQLTVFDCATMVQYNEEQGEGKVLSYYLQRM